MSDYTLDQLANFIHRASAATYAGGGSYEKVPERSSFAELVFRDGDWYYRDSYTGFYRSAGQEIIRYKNKIIWASSYCGGMVTGFEQLAGDTFDFLKQAMLAKPTWSFRGLDHFEQSSWQYKYFQKGDVISFSGHEEILLENKIVFSHDIIGGIIIHK